MTTPHVPNGVTPSDDAASIIYDRYLAPPTAMQTILARVLASADNRFQEICNHLTLEDCSRARESNDVCQRVHFETIFYPQTDVKAGHCSYLNTCHKTNRCKYLHFRPVCDSRVEPFHWQTMYPLDDPIPQRQSTSHVRTGSIDSNLYGNARQDVQYDEQLYLEAPLRWPARALHRHGMQGSTSDSSPELLPAQWINVNLKELDFSVLGKFSVVLADPPWDIHMSLPYETMSDDDLRSMPLSTLQDEGLFFLWVTGRAADLGCEVLSKWGYTLLNILVWLKVGQTQRLIRTGRTSHWLNSSKEICLIGIKIRDGATTAIPNGINAAAVDADVIVSEVRETSRKPDELYAIIERLCPKGRKLELFGRRHNARAGWITCGNQMKGDHIVDEELAQRLQAWRKSRWEWRPFANGGGLIEDFSSLSNSKF